MTALLLAAAVVGLSTANEVRDLRRARERVAAGHVPLVPERPRAYAYGYYSLRD